MDLSFKVIEFFQNKKFKEKLFDEIGIDLEIVVPHVVVSETEMLRMQHSTHQHSISWFPSYKEFSARTLEKAFFTKDSGGYSDRMMGWINEKQDLNFIIFKWDILFELFMLDEIEFESIDCDQYNFEGCQTGKYEVTGEKLVDEVLNAAELFSFLSYEKELFKKFGRENRSKLDALKTLFFKGEKDESQTYLEYFFKKMADAIFPKTTIITNGLGLHLKFFRLQRDMEKFFFPMPEKDLKAIVADEFIKEKERFLKKFSSIVVLLRNSPELFLL